MSRFRITIRTDDPATELRGFTDNPHILTELAVALQPFGAAVVISETAPDWTPFGPSAPEKVVTLPGDDPTASSRPPLDDWYPAVDRTAGGWGTRGMEGDG